MLVGIMFFWMPTGIICCKATLQLHFKKPCMFLQSIANIKCIGLFFGLFFTQEDEFSICKLHPYFKTNWEKHDWFVFHKFIGTKLKIIEEISWCQMGRTDFKQFMPFSACF
jgi:hypothetical protein